MRMPELCRQNNWLALDILRTSEDPESPCPSCAPPKPKVKWTRVSRSGKAVYLPMEDGKEAARYERALKIRPHPWVVRFSSSIGDSSRPELNITLGCNPASLVQRSLGQLPQKTLVRTLYKELASDAKCTFDWRVVPHTERVAANFPRLTFTSNKKDAQAEQPPNFSRFKLRKEQLRSLTWMLNQEATSEPFYEEEVCEEVLPGLNWRVEGRVRRPVFGRGGIIADEVCHLELLSVEFSVSPVRACAQLFSLYRLGWSRSLLSTLARLSVPT